MMSDKGEVCENTRADKSRGQWELQDVEESTMVYTRVVWLTAGRDDAGRGEYRL